MKVAELLYKVRQSRDEWADLVRAVDRDRMTVAGVAGQWSVKDLVSHVSWFEEQMVVLLDSRELKGSEWWQLPADERNQRIYEAHLGDTLDGVLQRSEGSYFLMTNALEALPEDILEDAANFSGMPPDWLPWQIVAQNSYEHYEAHALSVRRWLDDHRE